MVDRGKILGYTQILVEFGKFEVTELATIISDEDLGQSKVIDDGFLNEIFYFSFSDFSKWFSLYPLSGVINYYKQKLLSSNG